MAGKRRVIVIVMIFCLGINLDEVKASQYDACRRALLHSDFRTPCASLNALNKRPCLVSTAADKQYLKDAKIRYFYRAPGVTEPMICALRWNNTKNAECVSAPTEEDNSVDWIWSEWASSSERTSSRRVTLTGNDTDIQCIYVESLQHLEIQVFVDDRGELYVDGEQIGGTLSWPNGYTFSLGPQIQLIAFETRNFQGQTGPRALLNNGVKTDDKSGWVCSEEYELNWEQINFDDSHWTPANIDYAGEYPIGGGAMTLGCLRRGRGPDYFRKKL